MEWISSKAVYIGVGIFVTIAIVSGVIMSFTKVGEIYGQVQSLNISIKDELDNIYSKYSGAKLNGVDLLNVIKKYEQDDDIEVWYPERNEILKSSEYISHTKREVVILGEYMESGTNGFSYEKEYTVNVTEKNSKITIIFE